MTSPTQTEPVVADTAVTFRLADPSARLRGVRLCQEVRVPGHQLDFGWAGGSWTLLLPRPAVTRMEYLFELRHANDSRETITDPANPLRAAGAFGDKSVIEFPEYEPPRWLEWPDAAGDTVPFEVASSALGVTVSGSVWTPAGLTGAAPLLVAHDGPEYAALGGLLHFVAAMIAAGELAPLRLALLAPGERNRWYGANPAYARALATEVVPVLPAATVRIGAGASLGGLAMVHAHRSFPDCFDALFLQSSSFFSPALDPQERRFERFEPVTRFVAEVAQAVADPAPVPVAMTCGVLEENLANNRAMADTLRGLGYPLTFQEVADVHNFTAWRDALDPSLISLLRQVTG
jgi:enterochelin esterase family protein